LYKKLRTNKGFIEAAKPGTQPRTRTQLAAGSRLHPAQRDWEARRHPREGSHPCILIFIFLVLRQQNWKLEPPSCLQAGRRRRTRERSILAGPLALRQPACSVFASWSKLEPLHERAGLQPARLVSLQV